MRGFDPGRLPAGACRACRRGLQRLGSQQLRQLRQLYRCRAHRHLDAGNLVLAHDVVTNATGIRAIDIETNNLTIDCNGFSLSNLPAGLGRAAPACLPGVLQHHVRNCTIQRFDVGILIAEPARRGRLQARPSDSE